MTDSECLIGILTRLSQETHKPKEKHTPMGLDVTLTHPETGEVMFSANITHNLNTMATEAGCYEACWHPEKLTSQRARDLVPYLKHAVAELSGKPTFYQKFDAYNGWGTWRDFLPWLCLYLEACKKYPDAKVEASV